MVRVLILIMLFFTHNALSDALTAADIRARMQGNAAEKKASSERLKLMRDGSEQATLLNERELFYELPNGKRVQAILLPNGKRSPAITERGQLVPACYTTRGTLVAGSYDVKNKRVVCDIPANEIVYMNDDVYTQDAQLEHREKNGFSGEDVSPETPAPKSGNKQEPHNNQPIDKYGKAGASQPEGGRNTGRPAPRNNRPSGSQATAAPVANLPADFYMPGTSQASAPAAVSVMAFSKAKPYGIQRGTWVNVRLDRTVSSSESGQAEFTLEADIAGSYQTLPSGTVFFATKQINMSTKRMEAFVNLAKLPDGKEIKVQGWIYSSNQTAGLTGILERDREGENEVAIGNAALAGLGTAASAVGGGGTVAGAAIDSYTGEMVGNERKYGERAPAATIRVSPQRALLQISEPF